MKQQLFEAGLLRDFAPRRLGRWLVALEVPLGEAPILVGVADQEKAHLSIGPAAEDDAAGARLALGARLGTALTQTACHSSENAECEVFARIRLNVREQLTQLNHR